MSRTGSFPLQVAYSLLSEFCTPKAVVLDPFCGKGTTLLAGRMLGHQVFGADVAPEAVVCSAAKTADVTLESLLRYVSGIGVDGQLDQQIPDSVRTFFHDTTLAEILRVRDRLLTDMSSGCREQKDHATFVLAALLGILHGHASYSLSVPCAHAFSMSPEYVRRYARSHGLRAPLRDVRACLASKIAKLVREPLPAPVESDVRRGSALSISRLFPELVGQVDVVLTSPPYLAAQTYAKDNWLRLWVLGYSHASIKGDYLETNSIPTYGKQMSIALAECKKMLKPGGRFICIAGDVRVRRQNQTGVHESVFETGTFLADMCARPEIGLQVLELRHNSVPSKSRYFHALSDSNGHSKRELIERVFIARRPE